MKQNSEVSKIDHLYWFLLFFLSPILAVSKVFKHRSIKISKTIFILFCIFFGFTFVFSSDYETGSDSARYAAWLYEMHRQNLSWNNFVNILYNSNDGKLDILQPLITYIVAIFTEDARFLFAAFAGVFGYFYAQNIWLLFENIKGKLSKIHILYIAIFILLIPIWNINGFRFWTAAQIFLFGTLTFLVKRKKNYILFAALSLFVHFSFFIPILILFLYGFIGNKTKLYFVVFITSLFINSLNTEFLKSKFDSLPQVFQQKEIYLNEDIKESESVKKVNWYIKYNNKIINWICFVFLIFLFLYIKTYLSNNTILFNLYNFSLLYFSFANIIDSMPQGVRFFPIGQVVFFFLICLLLKNRLMPNGIRYLRNASIPFLILIFVVTVRRGFEFIGPSTIISNPIIGYWIDNGPALINFIK